MMVPFSDIVSFSNLAHDPNSTAPTGLVIALEGNYPTRSSAAVDLGELNEVRIGRASGGRRRQLRDVNTRTLHLEIPDPWLASTQVRLQRTAAGWIAEESATTSNATVNGAPLTGRPISIGDTIELGNTVLVCIDDLHRSSRRSVEPPGSEPQPAALCSLNPSLSQRLELLTRIARSNVPVLLTGETGTGKTETARALHELSERPGALVVAACANLPSVHVEDTLFGREEVSDEQTSPGEHAPGLLRAAHDGTLVLDEVAELSPACQLALLRALQDGEFTPVGANAPSPVNIRLITTTHRDLPAMVRAGRFRDDLYARIAGFHTQLPPLRERREDLGTLVAAALQRIAPHRAHTLRLSLNARRALTTYQWPMNIRELEQALAAAVNLAPGTEIEPHHLPHALMTNSPRTTVPSYQRNMGMTDDALNARLTDLLTEHRGNISAVARDLRKARAQVHRWLRRLNIDPTTYRYQE